MVGRSLFFAGVAVLGMYLSRLLLRTDLYLPDVGGISAFVTVFGTLYGIMAAFVVFEVWSQWNTTSRLIDKEAQGLERLFRLTLYFRDSKLTREMKGAIKTYASLVIAGKFQTVGGGQRGLETGKAFRKISEIIREIKFDDEHDSVVFNHVIDHYGQLGQIRTERINQSLARLPILLKTFLYVSSLFALVTFVVMPFSSLFYGFLAVGALGFILAMVFQLVEDLDNPFVGYFNLTPEPFERALKHIEKDY